MQIQYTVLHYRGLNGFEGFCDLRMYAHGANVVAVASEPIGDRGQDLNPGPAVTNAVEIIATLLRTELGYFWTHFVEHYPERGYYGDKATHGPAWFDETFDLVTFEWNIHAYAWHRPGRPNGYVKPHWKRTTRAVVEELIGQAFP